MENKKQVTVTQSHIKEMNAEHRERKEGRTKGNEERERESSRKMSLGVFKTPGEPRSFVMAGYLGSLNSFHSFRENKTALQAQPLVVLMFLLRPRRNVYHMEKQSPQRFTTGILSLSVKEEEVLCSVCRLSSEARERGSARERGGATPRESGGGCWEQLRS